MRSPLSSVRCPSNRLSASTWHNGCTPTKSSVHPYDIVLQYFLLIAAYRPPAASVSVRQKFDNLSDDLCLSVKHSLIVIGAQHQPNSVLHLTQYTSPSLWYSRVQSMPPAFHQLTLLLPIERLHRTEDFQFHPCCSS